MPCTVDTPCGNALYRFLVREDTVEIHHCLNGHAHLIGTPLIIPDPVIVVERARSGDHCGGCTISRRSNRGPCVRHGGMSQKERKKQYAKAYERSGPVGTDGCWRCRKSISFGNGPCFIHGGMSKLEREAKRRDTRSRAGRTRGLRKRGRPITLARPLELRPHYV